jgi:hypothetical protein
MSKKQHHQCWKLSAVVTAGHNGSVSVVQHSSHSGGCVQGDNISGRMSRQDAADVVAAALVRTTAVNKTFEVSRSRGRAIGGPQTFNKAAETREFLKLCEDRLRRKVGLPPMPEWVPPPPPLSEMQQKKVLQDPRVVQASSRNKEVAEKARAEGVAAGGADAASIALRKAAAKEWIQTWRENTSARTPAAAAVGAASDVAEDATEAIKGEVKAAQEWIKRWQAKGAAAPVAKAAAGSSGGLRPDVPSAKDIAARQAEIREWVAAWKEKTGGVKSGMMYLKQFYKRSAMSFSFLTIFETSRHEALACSCMDTLTAFLSACDAAAAAAYLLTFACTAYALMLYSSPTRELVGSK